MEWTDVNYKKLTGTYEKQWEKIVQIFFFFFVNSIMVLMKICEKLLEWYEKKCISNGVWNIIFEITLIIRISLWFWFSNKYT